MKKTVTYHAHNIATPIKAKMKYSTHENGDPSSYVDPSSVPESSSASGSYSSASVFCDLKKALMRSILIPPRIPDNPKPSIGRVYGRVFGSPVRMPSNARQVDESIEGRGAKGLPRRNTAKTSVAASGSRERGECKSATFKNYRVFISVVGQVPKESRKQSVVKSSCGKRARDLVG